jgi:hypothetical protein
MRLMGAKYAYNTMQIAQTAPAGMSSLQKERTRLRAEISKGIRHASYRKKFQPACRHPNQ